MSIKNLILGVSIVTVSYCSHWEGELVLEKANKDKQWEGLSGQNVRILKDLNDV